MSGYMQNQIKAFYAITSMRSDKSKTRMLRNGNYITQKQSMRDIR
jgi:hypothetical protein